jgi:sporulation protein YlmC with PRC-barrel domain
MEEHMSMRKFSSDLMKKSVMTVEGELIGTVDNIIVDTETGVIKSVLVKPSGANRYGDFPLDKEGRYMIPLKSMKSFKDVFVVDIASGQKMRTSS